MALSNPWEPEQGDTESQNKLQERALKLFNTCQCSWCKLFYTQPFLCVPGTLHSNCSFFKALSEQERQEIQIEKRNWSWSWRAIDMILRVQDHGVLKKCWICGSLNPNPDKYVCWKCGDDSLSRYDIYNISGDFDVVKEKSEGNKIFKICPNPKCGKRSLVINEKYNSYNCINPDCPDYGVPIFKYHKEHPQLPIDQIFQQQDKIEAEKKAQDESKEHPPSMFDEFIRQEKERIEAEKKALDESTAKARLWNGNQYWDEKKKKWRDGDQPIRIHRFPSWVVIIGVCIIISLIITLALNYLHPGTRYSFFIW